MFAIRDHSQTGQVAHNLFTRRQRLAETSYINTPGQQLVCHGTAVNANRANARKTHLIVDRVLVHVQ